MDLLYRLFDLFIDTARWLGQFIPQSGEDVIQMFNAVLRFAVSINNWLAATVGIDIQRILSVIGRFVVLGFNWFVEIVKALVERI